MDCRVVFLPDGIEMSVPAGTTISLAAKQSGVFIDSPCGGNGTCGKCEVTLSANGETRRVLACRTRIESDCAVTVQTQNSLSALDYGVSRQVKFEPYPFAATAGKDACFACFDLGTTTIVCYLLDATNGGQIASAACQNPQSAYGADVIARADYSLTSGHPEELKQIVTAALNELIRTAVGRANRKPKDVSLVSIVGNTVMLHLLLGFPLAQLVRAPYLPHATQRRIMNVSELGIKICAGAKVLIAPVIGGFVGADTVACLSATGFERIDVPAFLIDIGTNGELALTDGKRRVCCSTAAGPAFEGATLSCGMRAERGAVDHAWLENGELNVSTIDHAPARGICGSGLVEIAAALLRLGAIDESGRFHTKDARDGRFIALENGSPAYLVAEGDRRVALSQKDVRELQLGKAAVRAGIEVLLKALSLKAGQVEQVLLAGAFGAYLSPAALCDIGLFPEEFRNRTKSIGNAAGEGAKLYAKNFALFEESEALARGTEYVELSSFPAFMDPYVEAMAFPKPEIT